MNLTIAVNTTSVIQVEQDDEVLYRKHCFFPKIIPFVIELLEKYKADDFICVVLHGQPHYTSKLLSDIEEMFPNSVIIVK